MRERPIIFNDEMVRAILDGRKTQTRRPAQFRSPDGANLAFSGLTAGHYHTGAPQHGWTLYSRGAGGCWNARAERLRCPFGEPGDLLWVKECFARLDGRYSPVPLAYRADRDGAEEREGFWRWTPSIHMPRWASRLTLRVTDVRVERVQDITEEDARAEGVSRYGNAITDEPFLYRTGFEILWNAIYGAKGLGWDVNPWVWVVGFEMAEASDA